MPFSKERLKQFEELKKQYPEGRHKSALLPILHIAQEDHGWLPAELLNEVAEVLDIHPIEVYEVATFYTMFHVKPVGKYVLEVCRTGPCCLVGAENIIQYLKNKLNVEEGEITTDGLFTIKPVECLASCGTGPVLQIGPDYKYYENLTTEKIDQLIDILRRQG
ncbi:MAG: NAD(P)H-dependent oxidoreductase subunit E [Saprospiraceae bacterium]|nr:NAD(P)H-dependent oxidoreductase subunit E [Saprospiraceae bacterium]MBK8450813.1 NAD(P)H-dependent oxidoreductase subunit E [Saprospiraceae bacterium]MBK8485106.1 NAD(P)H-dependent oxidoreductase subunit E [Saprospiraceae bacterium]MBK9223093.1 NAD(P)H-dependent oxidoreductase subunit E [Saprospiraceae bacterium]MBK9720623.1 NAD(P)H-dependent oxidoreductase subunit E [Saprospiraceae bacterium]